MGLPGTASAVLLGSGSLDLVVVLRGLISHTWSVCRFPVLEAR